MNLKQSLAEANDYIKHLKTELQRTQEERFAARYERSAHRHRAELLGKLYANSRRNVLLENELHAVESNMRLADPTLRLPDWSGA
jgi:hypothetical protein